MKRLRPWCRLNPAAVSACLKRAWCLGLACAALVACTPELDWREVSVPEGRFAVLLPCKARPESRTLHADAGALAMTMYACSLQRGTMGVAYTDYPAPALGAATMREQLDAARDALLRNIGAGAQRALLKARFVFAAGRLYQIAYVGEHDALAMPDIDMFLTSFKLIQ